MLNPRYIIKYVFNRDTKESDTRVFDSLVQAAPDKFGNVETDTTKPVGPVYSNFADAAVACHSLNMEHQPGYPDSDLCQSMLRQLNRLGR